jgi:hypothetical protein
MRKLTQFRIGNKGAVIGCLLVGLMVSGLAQAVAQNANGTMSVVMSAGNQPTMTFVPGNQAGTGAQRCWQVGDTFTFTDTETTDNSANNNVVQVTYSVKLNQWIGGVQGPWIMTQSVTFNVAALAAAFNSNLVVTGTYTGWNGAGPIAPCALGVPIGSFQVYRTIGVNAPVTVLLSLIY